MKIKALALALFVAAANSLCPGQNLFENPRNPQARGPWAVGERTVTITSRNLTVEIFYPAFPGSEEGRDPVVYSVRDEWLPPFQAQKIPDEENPWQPIEAYRDLPLDRLRGPFPVHLHVHGTAAWRTASAHQLTHFASRGFVVLSADHPGINLKDMLSFRFSGVDQEGDARLMLQALATMEEPDLAFLKGHVDLQRIALSGHSAGGGAVGGMADVGHVIMPWCAWGVEKHQDSILKSSGVIGAVDDSIARYSGQQRGYETSPIPKRLIGVANSGHMLPTDICWIGKEHGGIVEIAKRNGIYLAYLFGPLGEDGCDDDQVKDERAWEIMNYVSSALQEEILLCDQDMTLALANLNGTIPEIFEYLEELEN